MGEKKFKIFDFNKEGKGVSKKDIDGPTNLNGFFRQYKRKFSRLLSVNIFMVLGNFPLFFAGFSLAGYGAIHSSIQSSALFPAVYTVTKFDPSPVTDALNSVYGIPVGLTANTTVSIVLMALSLLTLFTFGLTNVGTTYILRNLAKGDPVFMWSDFWYAIKRNWKQGILLGIIDILVAVVLCIDINFWRNTGLNFLSSIGFYASLAMLILYFFMRFYMYIMLVTFDLSLFKILKNSLIFAIIGFKRNIVVTLGIVILVILNLMLFFSPLQPLAIVLPLVLTISNGAFMSTYAAWFKIKEIMIDPYDEGKSDAYNEVPLAVDDVTE